MTTKNKILFETFPVAGIRLGTACAGIKKENHTDLVVIELAEGTQTAAVFTQNAFCAAPVTLSKSHLQKSAPKYLLVNTGNANAGTGDKGLEDARACCEQLAALAGCQVEKILPFSTGVIGEYLPTGKIKSAMPDALDSLSEQGWEAAANGILTTDTVTKGATCKLSIGCHEITISGIAKGSGMIRPDMATMLAYVATDVKISTEDLQLCLSDAVNHSFNRITVDGDTSTNDAALLMATGQSGIEVVSGTKEFIQFQQSVTEICETLAKMMIKDGEGATKLISIDVKNCATEQEALDVAYTVAHSPLVKTAFFACDPNWGRILAAVGRSGLSDLNLSAISIYLDDVCIVKNGGKASEYTEEQGQQVMDKAEITISIDLGRGEACTHVWTCDFSYDYVRINAEYRT